MSLVLKDIHDEILTLTVNRPESLNALNSQVIHELTEAFTVADKDPAIMGIILTGAGDRAFIAGADIKEMQEMSPDKAKSYAEKGQSLTRIIERMSKPVIAAVNGFALGGGCELAMACHFRYASETARFGQPEVGLGLIAGFGGTQRLPKLVGRGRGLELLLTGKMIDTREAHRIGLVNRVFPSKALIEACLATLKAISTKGPVAVKQTLAAVDYGIDRPMDEGLKKEAELFKEIFKTEDSKEGLNAFTKKRRPEFRGR